MDAKSQSKREVYQTIPLKFDGQIIRMVFLDNQPWFVAQDVGKVFGYKGRGIINRLHTCPIKERYSCFIDGEGKTLLMSLNALNSIIFPPRNPVAERFNLWLLKELSFLISHVDINQIETLITIKQLKAENDYLTERLRTKTNSKIKKDTKVTSLEKSIILKLKMVDCFSLSVISEITGFSEEIIYNTILEAGNE